MVVLVIKYKSLGITLHTIAYGVREDYLNIFTHYLNTRDHINLNIIWKYISIHS